MSLQQSGHSSHLWIVVRTFLLVSTLFHTLAPSPSRALVHSLSVVSSCHRWYQLMVGQLLFCSPLVISSDYDLHYTAEVCVLLTLPLLAHYHTY